jgi:hypothetical protein
MTGGPRRSATAGGGGAGWAVRGRKRAGGLAGLAWQADARWAARLGRVRRPAAARACWARNSWRATAPLAGLLGWRCCWVGLEDGLGIGFRN